MSGFNVKMTIQPINTYMMVERITKRPVKNSFKIMPASARPQIVHNTIQPVVPRIVTKANGV